MIKVAPFRVFKNTLYSQDVKLHLELANFLVRLSFKLVVEAVC